MNTIAIIAMNAGLLAQNYAEWRAGGPHPPFQGRADLTKDSTRKLALILVSAIVACASLIAILTGSGWLVAAMSAALIVNALFQLVASVWMGSLLPGTMSGLIFMLPTSLWAIASVQDSLGWLVLTLGPIGSVTALFVIWWISAKLTQTAS